MILSIMHFLGHCIANCNMFRGQKLVVVASRSGPDTIGIRVKVGALQILTSILNA